MSEFRISAKLRHTSNLTSRSGAVVGAEPPSAGAGRKEARSPHRKVNGVNNNNNKDIREPSEVAKVPVEP